MKKCLKILVFAVCLVFLVPAHGQFLKKLGRKVKEAAENKVSNKSADKTSDEVGQGFDKLFSKSAKRSKTSKPRSNYKFTYHYQMHISGDMGAGEMDYYFEPNADYMGFSFEQQGADMFMVFDYKKSTNYSFMSAQGSKMMTAASLDLTGTNDWVNNDYNKSEYRITDLPD